ncbi:sulfatase [Pedobacter sp. MC2016-05]|uniref:sulfatase family protein n=1 Tax=Pedobacter sp. MC2016-05 TaxID=2994474 RepID=UPI0022483122|nr:sulfatase [Pedobacter sp. MC2016-05]MCX2477003.1 sulfatase [Pedobacter sp. MC2016-05]
MKTKNFSILCLAMLVATSLIMSSCKQKKNAQSDGGEGKRPNILMVMSDNQSWNHVGVYGDPIVRTPNMDKVAKAGVRFNNAFCSSPSCTPARAAMLTGQDTWRLKEGSDLWSVLPTEFPIYTDLLEKGGYQVGFDRKGWGPGSFEANGRKRNPGGNPFKDFQEFLGKKNADEPWCYWVNSHEPHRPYVEGSGEKAGIDPKKVPVPGYLPDHISIRKDIADYYAAVETFDKELGEALKALEKSGELENTVIVVCSDNGWQMPRGLANLYDFGTHVPMMISWPGKFKKGAVVDNLVTLNDLAPTFLSLGKVEIPKQMTGKSLLSILSDNAKDTLKREFVVLGRERHAFVRQHGLGYPGRAIRTKQYLYIKNYEPARWPAGDPQFYGDIDPYMFNWPGETKYYLIENKDKPAVKPFFELGMGKRPAEELFDITKDPDELHNLASLPAYAKIKKELSGKMVAYLKATNDPRETGGDTKVWDNAPYFSEVDKKPKPSKAMQKRFNLDSAYDYLK